ncbi:MAG TPA: carbohydrate binding domain-containing protein [Bryobacteraceae bacterium]|nr:carbohydrate binding domain-containing protein [Bryobacteraceae bacterium]
MVSTRVLTFATGVLTLAYSGMDLAARHYWQDHPEVESATCRLMICADDIRVAETYRSLISGQESRDTVAAFRAVLSRDSVSAYRWSDLGEAFLSRGSIEDARKCFTRAVEVAPYSPTILLRTATFYFRIGETKSALPHTSRILGLIDVYDHIVFSYYSRLGIPISDILKTGLPDSERAIREYFRYSIRSAPASAVAQTWRLLLSRRLTDLRTADEYVRALVGRSEFAQARNAWLEHLASHKVDPGTGGVIFNAGFEQQPANAISDWQIENVDGVEIARDEQVRHAGSNALHVQFSGSSNLHFRNVIQLVGLEAGTYRLSAYVRTQGITTDKGVGLRLVRNDAADHVLARTPDVRGTTEWTRVETTFRIDSLKVPVRLEVSREPSMRLDNKVKGEAWVDSIRLEPMV